MIKEDHLLGYGFNVSLGLGDDLVFLFAVPEDGDILLEYLESELVFEEELFLKEFFIDGQGSLDFVNLFLVSLFDVLVDEGCDCPLKVLSLVRELMKEEVEAV